MIPKIIHCFIDGPLACTTIDAWKRECTSFSFKEWSIDNVEKNLSRLMPHITKIRTIATTDVQYQRMISFVLLYTYGGFFVMEDVRPFELQNYVAQDCVFFTNEFAMLSNCVYGVKLFDKLYCSILELLNASNSSYDVRCWESGICCVYRIMYGFPWLSQNIKIANLGQEIGGSWQSLCTHRKPPEPDVPIVFVAILARNCEHVLPLYLECLSKQDYPKNNIHIYIYTNNNTDGTSSMLKKWLLIHHFEYMSFEFKDETVLALHTDYSDLHDWNANPTRLKVLAQIRQHSLDRAVALGVDYYFVSDCDNFLLPHTLSSLIDRKKEFVSPMLRCIGHKMYSNFVVESENIVTNLGESEESRRILFRKHIGLHSVYVAHCTYLLDVKTCKDLSYTNVGKAKFEFINFSNSAREHDIIQYTDNTINYGVFLHFWIKKETEKSLIEKHSDKIKDIMMKMKDDQDIENDLQSFDNICMIEHMK